VTIDKVADYHNWTMNDNTPFPERVVYMCGGCAIPMHHKWIFGMDGCYCGACLGSGKSLEVSKVLPYHLDMLIRCSNLPSSEPFVTEYSANLEKQRQISEEILSEILEEDEV
jgi:hypothetical protein